MRRRDAGAYACAAAGHVSAERLGTLHPLDHCFSCTWLLGSPGNVRYIACDIPVSAVQSLTAALVPGACRLLQAARYNVLGL